MIGNFDSALTNFYVILAKYHFGEVEYPVLDDAFGHVKDMAARSLDPSVQNRLAEAYSHMEASQRDPYRLSPLEWDRVEEMLKRATEHMNQAESAFAAHNFKRASDQITEVSRLMMLVTAMNTSHFNADQVASINRYHDMLQARVTSIRVIWPEPNERRFKPKTPMTFWNWIGWFLAAICGILALIHVDDIAVIALLMADYVERHSIITITCLFFFFVLFRRRLF